MGSHFSSHAFPWRLRYLHLVARQIQRLGVSLGRELALRDAAVHWHHRVCVHRLASLHGALAHAWQVDICKRRRGHAESLVPRFLCPWVPPFFLPPWFGHL